MGFRIFPRGMFRRAFNTLIRSTVVSLLGTLSIFVTSTPIPIAAARVAIPYAARSSIQPASGLTAAPRAPLVTDPYGDAASYSGACLGTASNAVGAPDGAYAAITGLGCNLTVTFVQTHTGNLRLYVQSNASLAAFSSVDILRGASVVQSIPSAVDLSVSGTQTITVLYTGTLPYDGVRFNALATISLGVDAVETLADPPLPADAYANFGQLIGLTCPHLVGTSADAADGPPDRNVATLAVGANCALLLDMGRGQEGLGNLTVYYSSTAQASVSVTVSLLDANSHVLTSTSTLLDLSPSTGPQTATLSYPNTATPYRYVLFSHLTSQGPLTKAGIVDAVQAQYYNGVDTDGDGLITNCPTPGPGQECAGDQDGDGILDYLDNDSLNNAQTQKRASATSVRAGSLVTYDIVLYNAGVVTLTPTITDHVPLPLQVVSTIPFGSQTGNNVVWPAVTVPPAVTITLILVAKAPLSGTAPYTAANSFEGSLPAAFFYNKLPIRTAPMLSVWPYTTYMPITLQP